MTSVDVNLHLAGQQLGVSLSEEQRTLIANYLRLLFEYNQHTNLVSKADPELVLRDHVMDALSLVKFFHADRSDSSRLIDIGSGAGFPGIILAIACPWLRVTLVDSIAKKTRFLSESVTALRLGAQVTVLTGRAEELAHKPELRESFQLATARAVGKLDLVCELALPFLTLKGMLLAQKSRQQAQAEVPEARKSVSLLGGEIKGIEQLDAQVLGKDLVVVLVEKTKHTPPRYPRSASQLKRPL